MWTAAATFELAALLDNDEGERLTAQARGVATMHGYTWLLNRYQYS